MIHLILQNVISENKTMALPNWYNEYKNFIEQSIDTYLNRYLALPMSHPLEEFKEVVLYSFRGWKKLRSILALEFYLSLSGKDFSSLKIDDDIVKVCIALESVHAFSLLHDDLPCMDNDVMRRGEPTVWKKYGEHNWVLAGDMLNTLCFELISDMKDAKISQQISKLISHSVGFYGMIWGQIEDIYFENNHWDLDISQLSDLHAKKTWKLIQASILSWVILSWEVANIDIFWDFGKKLWLAFQIKDDLLDVEWTLQETGKSVWDEEKWFVYLIWVAATRKILKDIIVDCHTIAGKLGSEKIDFIVDYIENRNK